MNNSLENRNFIVDFWTLFFDPRVAALPKIAFLVAIPAYIFFPLDLIPDVILPLGFVDDGGLLLGAMFAFVRVAQQQIEQKKFMIEEQGTSDNDALNLSSINSNRGGGIPPVWGCFATVGFLALLIFLAVMIPIVSGVSTINNLIASIGNAFGQPATASVTSSRTIITSLQPLGQLVSISAEVAQADINVSVHTGGINLCGHSANHVAQGAVEAGVDISQVDENSVHYHAGSNTYTLMLPPPSITSCRIEYIRQYERSGGSVACPVDWDTVRLIAQYEATRLFAADTLEAGILDRAERETTLLMQSFVSALTGGEVKVTYGQAEDEAILPPSCQPQLPRGWTFDAELNSWVQTG